MSAPQTVTVGNVVWTDSPPHGWHTPHPRHRSVATEYAFGHHANALDALVAAQARISELEAFELDVAIAYGELTGDYNDKHCVQYATTALDAHEARLRAILRPTRLTPRGTGLHE